MRYQACAQGHLKFWCASKSKDRLAKCRALLARGDIDLELRDGKQKTALMWAVDNGNIGMTRELVKAGADVSDRRDQLREKNQKYQAKVRAEGARCSKSDIERGETTATILAILEVDDAGDTDDADGDAVDIDIDDDTAPATGKGGAKGGRVAMVVEEDKENEVEMEEKNGGGGSSAGSIRDADIEASFNTFKSAPVVQQRRGGFGFGGRSAPVSNPRGITADDLRRAEAVSSGTTAEEMISEADLDQSGFVTLEEYALMVRGNGGIFWRADPIIFLRDTSMHDTSAGEWSFGVYDSSGGSGGNGGGDDDMRGGAETKQNSSASSSSSSSSSPSSSPRSSDSGDCRFMVVHCSNAKRAKLMAHLLNGTTNEYVSEGGVALRVLPGGGLMKRVKQVMCADELRGKGGLVQQRDRAPCAEAVRAADGTLVVLATTCSQNQNDANLAKAMKQMWEREHVDDMIGRSIHVRGYSDPGPEAPGSSAASPPQHGGGGLPAGDCYIVGRLPAPENMLIISAGKHKPTMGRGKRSDARLVCVSDIVNYNMTCEVSSRPVSNASQVCFAVGTFMKDCLACYECMSIRPGSGPANRGSAFASYCHRTIISSAESGHSMANPRHPNTMCHTCLGRHVEVRLGSGKLFVVCPFEGCGRTLQTAEVKTFAKPEAYDKLIERLREAEESAYSDASGAADRAALAGLELRLCPKCKVRIEKNQGCDQMSCYRCGSRFQWSSAEPAFRPEAVPSAADGFQFGSGEASPADGGAAFPAFSADVASFGGVGFSFGAPVATDAVGPTSTVVALTED